MRGSGFVGEKEALFVLFLVEMGAGFLDEEFGALYGGSLRAQADALG